MRKCFLFYIKDNFIPIENNNNSAVIMIEWTSGTAAVCSLQPSGWLAGCLSVSPDCVRQTDSCFCTSRTRCFQLRDDYTGCFSF